MKPAASVPRLVLGLQPVRELIRARGQQVQEVLLDQKQSLRLQALERFALDHDIAVRAAGRGELDRLSGNSLHQGVAAYGPPLEMVDVDDLWTRSALLALALDGVVDPQNFGATIRSAVGLASAPLIWAESASAPLTPATFRASAGAIEHAELCRVPSLHGTLGAAAAAGVQVIGLEPQATSYLHELTLDRPTIIVVGSEQKGMGRAVRKACSHQARLVMSGTIQSLNASVAAGIALHTVRQWRLGSGRSHAEH